MYRIAILAVLVGVGACSAQPSEEERCIAALDGRQFVHALDECGLCECGEVALCDWIAAFDGAHVSWNFSDYGDEIDFTCTDGEIRDVATGHVRGTYDPDTDRLTLDGASYAPCDGECEWHFQDCACATP